ncbi:MAG: hypothetical protein NE330_13460 [Lentisphaeraceae bacterium]|nr:hypothetical protein [Lentisphaeraceae bacterium]
MNSIATATDKLRKEEPMSSNSIAYYRKMLRQDPEDFATHLKLTELYTEENRFEKAKQHALKAYFLNDSSETFITACTSLLYAADIPSIVTLCSDAAKTKGFTEEIKYMIGQIVIYLEKCISDGQISCEELISLIRVHTLTREYEKALSYIQQAKVTFANFHEVENELMENIRSSWLKVCGARRYINPKYSITEFFTELKERNISYVVLRWFEDLPEVEEGEDIDFLVADKDIDAFNELLVPAMYPGAQKIDLYSETGVKGTGYHSLPYYQTNLSREILKNRIFHKDLFACPDPKSHLLSLLYHIVYHKSEASGLPVTKGEKYKRGEHDYPEIVQTLANELQINIPDTNLVELHSFLSEHSWAPSIDLIRKLSTTLCFSPWLASLYPKQIEKTSITVYVIREWGRNKNLLETTIKLLEAEGLEILFSQELKQDTIQRSKDILRGGNWGAGPWPVSGGAPYAIIVALDQNPLENISTKTHPYLYNQRFHNCKENLRQFVNAKLPNQQKLNYIHCCDDTLESLEYLDILVPQEKEKILAKKQSFEDKLRSPFEVIKNFDRFQRRARIKLISFHGKTAICKIYKDNRDEFMKREVFAYGELSKSISSIPKLLDKGENWIVIEHIDHDVNTQNEIIKDNLDQVAKLTIQLWEHGYAHLDLHPDNILAQNNGKLCLIDFEFLYKYPTKPVLEDSYDLVALPKDVDVGRLGNNDTVFEYNTKRWKESTGYTLREIVENFASASSV